MISPTDIFLLGAFFGSTACSLCVIFYYMSELIWGRPQPKEIQK